MRIRARLALCLLLPALAACESGFDPPSKVDGLRVLAVRPDPASGSPGGVSTLQMTLADRVRGDAGPRAVQVAWLGGCHNPPTRQYFACFPLLSAIAERLAPRVVDTSTAGQPPGYFGTGQSFDVLVPEDILSAAPRVAADPIHFGVSYTFFAACAGELRPRPDFTNRVPLECVDPATGATLGNDDFVTGYTTLFSYEGARNQNPVVTDLRFAGVALGQTCAVDADCTNLPDFQAAELDAACADGLCIPRIAPCSGGDCRKYLVDPILDPSAAERMPNESVNEVVWANYYGSAGRFDTSTQLVNDPASGWIDDHGALFRAPAEPVGRLEIWVTVHDQRGGADVRAFAIEVR